MEASLSSQDDGGAQPAYLQIARLGLPRAVKFQIGDLWVPEPVEKYQEPYIASHSGGLVELIDAYLEQPPFGFIYQTAKEYARSLVSKQSLLMYVHLDLASTPGEEMVLGYDLARVRVQCQNQRLAVKMRRKNVFNSANEMDPNAIEVLLLHS